MLKVLYKRMENSYIDFTHEDQNKYLKSLRICVNITERITTDWYDDTYFYLVDNTMSIDEMFIPIENSDCSMLNPDWKISSDMNKYVLLRDRSENIKERDKDILFKLIRKYVDHWWC